MPSNCRSADRVDRPRAEDRLGEADGAGLATDCGRPGDGRSGRGGIGVEEGRGAAPGVTGRLVLLNKLVSGSEEAGGILGATVHPHFIVQMNAGGASCGPHGADALAERDLLAGLDGHGVQMGETGLETVAMVYLNGVAIP